MGAMVCFTSTVREVGICEPITTGPNTAGKHTQRRYDILPSIQSHHNRMKYIKAVDSIGFMPGWLTNLNRYRDVLDQIQQYLMK